MVRAAACPACVKDLSRVGMALSAAIGRPRLVACTCTQDARLLFQQHAKQVARNCVLGPDLESVWDLSGSGTEMTRFSDLSV